MKWYPIKFNPIPKQRLWGGQKLKDKLNKPFIGNDIGESWEISGVNEAISIVNNGALKGRSLQDIIEEYTSKILGNNVYEIFNNEFPLLIKYIDANQDLSVQLHPNDILAKQRHNSFGKTEMWYIMDAEPTSRLVLGFKEKVDESIYKETLSQGSLPKILNEVPVKAGDTFFIPTGTVHAIGAGILLAEIQQTSDITYRIYDWDRVDADGNSRTLHQEEAIAAINYDFKGEKVTYEQIDNTSNTMISCPYFTTNLLPISGKKSVSSNVDSFVIYMCVSGKATIEGEGFSEDIHCGETILIPAALKDYIIVADHAKLLEVFILSN